MDADEDGKHIQVLSSSTLKRMIPRAFSENMVHTIEAALYNAQIGDKVYYAESITALKEKIGNKKVPINRVKGWGGIEKKKLEEIAFDPNTRNLTCVTDIEGKEHQEYIKLVGNDPLYRKKMLGISVTATVEEDAE
jgi:DNA gyrase/topoisomerase IV subunit B